MAQLPLTDLGRPKRLFEALGSYLNLNKLKSLTKSRADRGQERYRRAGITASTSFISKALTILISFVSVPLTVHYLGAERYGVWLTISSIMIWMAMTDFGLAGNALINVVSEAHGRDDRQTAREYTASAFWALTTVAFGLSVIFVASFNFIPWRSVFRVSTAVSTGELRAACAFTLLFFVLNVPLSLLPSIYSAYQDGFVANIWMIASNSLTLISLIVVTQFRGGLPQLVVALSGTRALVGLANAYSVFGYRYRWLLPVPSAVSWSRVSRLLKLGGKYMVTQLAGLGIYQSQPLIITQMLGPAQVVPFVVAYKIICLPMDLVYMGTAPFIPAFGEAKVRADWNWIRGAYRNATVVSLGFGVPATLAIALCATPLIRIWAGPAAIPGGFLVVWLSVYSLIGIAFMAAGQMLSGLEMVEPLALSLVLCAIGCVGLGLLFAPIWGLNGVALAMAVSKLGAFWPIMLREVRRVFRVHAVQVPQQPELEVAG